MKFKQFWILICISLLGVGAKKVDYSGFKVYRIITQSEDDLDFLKSLQESESVLDFWLGPSSIGQPADLIVPPHLQPSVADSFRNQSLQYSVMIEDVQILIDKELWSVTEAGKQKASESTFDEFDYSAYHPYTQIVEWINTIANSESHLASFFQIGKSYEGRDINGLKLGSTKSSSIKNKRKFWINAAMHSREWITTATTIFLIKELIKNYGVDPVATRMLDEIEWYIVPILNVDGYVYTWEEDRFWRKTRSINYIDDPDNCVGVDPNRNWGGGNWGGEGASEEPCDPTYRGSKEFSEIEISQAAEFILREGPFSYFNDIHCYTQLLLSPYCYKREYPPQEDYQAHSELSKRAIKALEALYSTNYTYGPCAESIYIASGSSLDWAYDVAGILHSYSFELRDTGHYGFLLPEDQIVPTAEETYEALRATALYILDPTIDYPPPENSSGAKIIFSLRVFLGTLFLIIINH